MMAAASFARSIFAPIALAIGGLDVPEELPGVDAGATAGTVDEGIPAPGVRLVVHPTAAIDRKSAAAPARRNPLPAIIVRFDVFECIEPPCLAVI
jgi:hypothetical protein